MRDCVVSANSTLCRGSQTVMVQRCWSMKKATKALFGVLVAAVAVSALVAPAAAEFVHPKAIFMSTYPPELLIFWDGPGNYAKSIGVAIYPPWYFVEDLMGFDTITITARLASDCITCGYFGDPLTLLNADAYGRVVVQWSSVTMAEEDNGAFLEFPITFVISSTSGTGYYFLYLTAEARSSQATFYGSNHIPVSVSPGWNF